MVGVPGGEGVRQGLRIGEADVLAREADQPAGHVARVFAGASMRASQ